MKPGDTEPLDKFLLRAQVQANKCSFGESETNSREIAIVDKMIALVPQELRRKILEKEELNLTTLSRMINTHLSIQSQSRELDASSSTSGTALNTTRYDNLAYVNKASHMTKYREESSTPCGRCGYSNHKTGNPKCPAIGKKCNACQGFGHFERVCKNSGKRKTQDPPRYSSKYDNTSKKFKVHALEEVDDSEEERLPDDLGFIYTISDNHDELIWCNVGGVKIEMMIDSGSKYNIIGEPTLEYLKKNGAKMSNERSSSISLVAYAQPSALKIYCVFDAKISISDLEGKGGTQACFHVVQGGRKSLLGRDSAKELGVLRVGLPSTKMEEEINQLKGSAAPFPKIKGKKV